ncbi:reverse transcriptase domain-containing protein [Tanacetum coccineum]
MAKWTFELGAFDINYRPRTSIRGQVLADFIAERPDKDGPPTRIQVEKNIPEPWTFLTDGSSCLEGSGAILIITNPEGMKFVYALRFKFNASNSEAEYEALVAGLRIAKQMGGIDISGLFPEAQGKVKFLIVAINYFTKFASVKPPQTNGQVERANRSLGEGIKARLGEGNKNWIEEVSHVLWAHRIMIKTRNGNTLFSLTYGTKAMIPVEIGMPSLRCSEGNQAMNDEALLLNMDVLEEEREKAAIRVAKSKAKMEKYYNAKVRITTFKPRDFVYRNNEASYSKEGGKLGPK